MFASIINSPRTSLQEEGSCSMSKPLWFHVWHVLPVTVVIPLLPTGGFPSPAFPLPSSVIRAWGREKHNYRTEEIITQRLRRLHVTGHHRRWVPGKGLLHHPIIWTPLSYTGESLTRSHQSLKLYQLFVFIMGSTKVKMYRFTCMCTYDRDAQFPGKTITSTVWGLQRLRLTHSSASWWDTYAPWLYKAGGLL